MKRRRPLLSALAAVAGLSAASGAGPVLAQQAGHGAQQAVFATKAGASSPSPH